MPSIGVGGSALTGMRELQEAHQVLAGNVGRWLRVCTVSRDHFYPMSLAKAIIV